MTRLLCICKIKNKTILFLKRNSIHRSIYCILFGGKGRGGEGRGRKRSEEEEGGREGGRGGGGGERRERAEEDEERKRTFDLYSIFQIE